MESAAGVAEVSKGALWTGRVVSGLMAALLTFDAALKFTKPAQVIDAFNMLAIPRTLIVPIAVILLVCVPLYVLPPTSILGAILLTGYLGGAVCTHLRHQDPLFSHVLFPAYVGTLVWLGLFLREPRLRALVPFRS